MRLEPGMIVRHHSGRVYSILLITNTNGGNLDRFPPTVVYRGANGHVWSRPAAEFDGRFTVLFDGTTLAPTSQQ